MHRLSSAAILRKFRVSSFLVLITILLPPVALGFLVYGVLSNKHEWMVYAAAVVAGWILLTIVNFVISSRLKCPLCMVPPLLNKSCSRHRNAVKMLGSYRLKVAHSIIFRDSFRCPYCGEPTAMQVRKRHH